MNKYPGQIDFMPLSLTVLTLSQAVAGAKEGSSPPLMDETRLGGCFEKYKRIIIEFFLLNQPRHEALELHKRWTCS